MTWRHVIKRKLYTDIVTMIPMYSYHFILTYLVFVSLKWSVAYWFFYRIAESGWFIWVAQCNHIVMDVHDDDGKESCLSLQVSNI